MPSYFYTLLKHKIYIAEYSINTWRQAATASNEIIFKVFQTQLVTIVLTAERASGS